MIEIFDKTDNIRHGVVKYEKIDSVNIQSINVDEIPFTKRYPYTLENEYRVIWEGETNEHVFEIPISLDLVNLVTFGQAMPDPVFRTLRGILESRYPQLKGKINRSTIYENRDWIDKFK